MKLVSFYRNGKPRFGALVGEKILDLSEASAALARQDQAVQSLPDTIEAYFEGIETYGDSLARTVAHYADGSAHAVPRGDVKLAPPISHPPKIICVARNYAEHAREAGFDLPKMPILFGRFASTLVADGDPVVVPRVSDNLDWEGELAVIIGRHTKGRRITKAEAMDYVFGYSIFNDVTVRDYQFRVTQYTAGKNFRASGPFGPAIVTADELGDPNDLDIETTINGKRMQAANTGTMIFDIPTILEHIAEFIDLEPGDVIPMGTPAGVGFKRNPPLFLKPGDRVEVTISKLGTLSNPVVGEAHE